VFTVTAHHRKNEHWTFIVRFRSVSRMITTLDIAEGVATLTLRRPKVRNAITVELLQEASDHLMAAEQQGARALVLTGEGSAFCAGADLALVQQAFAGDPPSILRPLMETLHQLIRRLRAAPFPTVAAVEGFAVGAGMGLALAADLRIVARSAKFVPGYFGIGASPDGGVSYFLTRALGGAAASSIVLRNRSLDAEEICSRGMAEELVDDGGALEAAQALAARLAGAVPPLALIRTRRLVDAATTQGLDEQLDAEEQAVSELWPSEDFHEGVAAFLERRKPQFKGE
jgi:2-(1,2-epoxy-1,2-dihydrophenyl)acetyl-CoA isomerase